MSCYLHYRIRTFFLKQKIITPSLSTPLQKLDSLFQDRGWNKSFTKMSTFSFKAQALYFMEQALALEGNGLILTLPVYPTLILSESSALSLPVTPTLLSTRILSFKWWHCGLQKYLLFHLLNAPDINCTVALKLRIDSLGPTYYPKLGNLFFFNVVMGKYRLFFYLQ